MPATTQYATNRSQRIAYTVQGAGNKGVIVLQHGWTSSKETWKAYAELFVESGYRCISIDSLGHGESDKPRDRAMYQRADRANDVIAVMDAEGVDRAHFIGYSMGGWIACCVAEFHANRLLSLMIGGHCPGTGSTEEMGSPADELLAFDRVLELYDFGFSDDVLPAMRHSFDALEDVAGHEEAVANAGVPLLLWKGRGEPVICRKGEKVAQRHGWAFFSVEGDHMQAALNHEPNLPHLLTFLSDV